MICWGLSRTTGEVFGSISISPKSGIHLRSGSNLLQWNDHATWGFPVAVHVDPESIIDEVLGVGDQRFQAKCFDRIGSSNRRARLCFLYPMVAKQSGNLRPAIWLDHGKMLLAGTRRGP